MTTNQNKINQSDIKIKIKLKRRLNKKVNKKKIN